MWSLALASTVLSALVGELREMRCQRRKRSEHRITARNFCNRTVCDSETGRIRSDPRRVVNRAESQCAGRRRSRTADGHRRAGPSALPPTVKFKIAPALPSGVPVTASWRITNGDASNDQTSPLPPPKRRFRCCGTMPHPRHFRCLRGRDPTWCSCAASRAFRSATMSFCGGFFESSIQRSLLCRSRGRHVPAIQCGAQCSPACRAPPPPPRPQSSGI